MEDFINTAKLPLSSAPYSIALLASANGLWSLIHSSLFSTIYYYFLFILKKKKKKKAFMGDSSSSLY